MMRPVQIWIGSYYHMSGGIRALHVLRDELLARNIQAWMTYQLPAVNVPDAITIYPEIVSTNPMDAQRIVRWKLNKAELPDDGLTVAWETGMGDHPLLTVNIVEDFFYPRPNKKTNKVAYWIGKGLAYPEIIPAGAEEISRNNHPDRQELAEYIASLDYLISFDPFTTMNLEAVLSDTPVLIHAPHNTWKKAHIQAQGWLPYGVAWDPSELAKARDTVHRARGHYEALKSVFSGRIDAFVDTISTRWP